MMEQVKLMMDHSFHPLLFFNVLFSWTDESVRLHCCFVLLQRCPPSFVSDLFSDLRDGSQLLDLLEVMSGQPMVSYYNVLLSQKAKTTRKHA